MEMIAHSPKMAKKAGVPQSVGKDFAAADKNKTFKGGGKVADLKKLFKGKDTKSEELKEAKAIKSGKITPEQYAKGEKMEDSKMKKYLRGGPVKPTEKPFVVPPAPKGFNNTPTKSDGDEKYTGKPMPVVRKAKGGSIKEARLMPAKMEKIPQGNKKFGEHVDQKKGHTKGKNLGGSGKTVGLQVEKKFKCGGCVTRGDGIAQKGKTKGKWV